MTKATTLLALMLLMVSALWAGQRVELGTIPEDALVTVIETSDTRTVLQFEIGSFIKESVQINGEEYYRILCGEEGVLSMEGEPAVPRICRSIIIPDDAEMRISVLTAEYQDFPETPVAPSKGTIYRTVNPGDVPYTFGAVYGSDQWYPLSLAQLREPYILRDFRGSVIEIYPFQYNPASRTLRVYTLMKVEVRAEGSGRINVLHRRGPFTSVTPDFDLIYRERFINYNQGTLLYNPVNEVGDMLIITYDAFRDAMDQFVEWKRQKGVKATIVNVSTIGNNATALDNFIQAFYDSTNLAWVLLVGDAAQVATPYASGGASDPSYAKVAGNDNYPDIFIGRFSAENLGQAQTQILRTINYERYPQTAGWYHQGTGIASDQGPGHYGEYDYQHMDLIRNDLLAYNYTLVDQIYDPGATAAQVSTALNAGRSFVNYCGHGTATSWGTTGFSNSNVSALVNDNMLPFIISVACNNGEFDSFTCFGEAWLRASHNGNPTGAMGAYMSSISQSWDPPMYAQDEAVDLLVAESKLTFGGICFNGSCYMMDVEGAAGVEMYDTWHIFGDPSVMLYTDTPAPMTVNHDNAVIFTMTQITVEAVGVSRALCAIYRNGVLYGSAYTATDGFATIPIAPQLPVGEVVTLTVTAYNKLPYEGSIQVIAPAGPYVVYDSCSIDDAAGNGNGLIEFGESIVLGMQLINVGPDQANNVSATLSTTDSYVTVTDAAHSFGNIPGDNGTAYAANAFAFDIALDAPDEHSVSFTLEVTGSAADTWTSHFSLSLHAPEIGFAAVAINDQSGGNGNGILDAGETANLIVTLSNGGSVTAGNVAGVMSESDDYIVVSDPNGSFGNIASGGSADNVGDPFVIVADSSFPQGHSVAFDLAVTADGGYTKSLQFTLRTAESFEYSDGGYVGSGDWQWGEPTYGPPGAYFGTKCWGTNLSGNYGSNRNDPLVNPQVHIHSQLAQLEFYHWYDIEDYYDGGNVSISTNGGASWTLITPQGGYPHSGIYSLGEPGYTNASGGWVQAIFSLGNYIGRDVKFRWRFASDGIVNAPGWYIDDVAITGNLPLPPPELAVDPTSYAVSLDSGFVTTRDLRLVNSGDGPLYFTLLTQTDERGEELSSQPISTLQSELPPLDYAETMGKGGTSELYFAAVDRGQGGPDAFGYYWIDSNEPNGPVYNWVDITSIGTLIPGIGDDGNLGPFPIGFNFEFYGNAFTSFRFADNGFVSFTSSSGVYLNSSLPSAGAPFNLLAPFWDDLNFEDGGSAYYYTNNSDSLVISWIGVPHWGGGGPYTFQIILLANGKIFFQYQAVGAPLNSCTVGIQNGNGTIGLQIVYNQGYLASNMAIKISASPDWLTVTPTSGTIPAHDSLTATVTFDATELATGVYTGSVVVSSNDPVNPIITIPAILDVGSGGIADIALSPTSISDSLAEGSQSMHQVIILNNGTGNLSVIFSTQQTWITLAGGPFSIGPAARDTLTVTLNATGLSCGDHSGSISFTCNDPDMPSGNIPVSLHVYFPNIAVSPLAVADTLEPDESSAKFVVIDNVGLGRLHYTISYQVFPPVTSESGVVKVQTVAARPTLAAGQAGDGEDAQIRLLNVVDEWLTITPTAGIVDPSGRDTLTVMFDATGMAEGTYAGEMTVTSDDPDSGTILIPITLIVGAPYFCDYLPGDVNSDGRVIGSDITYGVLFLRGAGNPPPDSCFNDVTGSWLYVAADANGDCAFLGGDIMYLVSYFRAVVPVPEGCPQLPPSGGRPASHSGEEIVPKQ